MTTATTHRPIADADAREDDRRGRDRSLRGVALTLLKPLASLKLTVVLFALSIFLIFAATLAQVETGIWQVMEVYFKAPIAWVPLELFVRGSGDAPNASSPAIPMPGGVVLGSVMLANLLAAHALRFKMKAHGLRLVAGLLGLAVAIGIVYVFHYVAAPHELLVNNGLPVLFGLGAVVYAPLIAASAVLFGKRLGIVLVHASLILLLVGEGVSAYARHESQLAIYEGQTVSWSHDIRDVELAVIEAERGEGRGARGEGVGTEKVVAIPRAVLTAAAKSGEPISHPELPFDVVVEMWFKNATLFRLPEGGERRAMADAGVGLEAGIRPQPPASGVGDQRVNMPSAVVRFSKDGETLGRYIVSVGLQSDDYVFRRQDVPLDPAVGVGPSGELPDDVAAETPHREVVLRFERVAMPASFTLHDFRHDLYPGTNVPKNFSSDVRIVNPAANEDRTVNIYMNHPLRYAGLTFFQSGYLQGNRGTILQVVENPAAQLPYIACITGGMGLAIHFALSLGKFLGKRRKMAAKPAA